MIAEPKALYRERYSCETDPNKNRAQRYIRTEDGNLEYEYPTVQVLNNSFLFFPHFCILQIPSKWRSDPSRHFFIRVTPVTIKSENAPDQCIHPYEIVTQENNVLTDTINNSLYFPINEKEFRKGIKR